MEADQTFVCFFIIVWASDKSSQACVSGEKAGEKEMYLSINGLF